MTKTITHLLLPLIVLASLESRADESKIWLDNKLTEDQPFPARVLAVLPSWVGYHLLLEEINGKERLCVAQAWITVGLRYRLLEEPKVTIKETLTLEEGWIYLDPSIELSRFSWSIGAHRLGRVFGKDDLLVQITAPRNKAPGEQDGADQPATDPESKPENKEKLKQESEVRPQ